MMGVSVMAQAHLHFRAWIWIPTRIPIPSQMATLLIMQNISHCYFCTGQESEYEFHIRARLRQSK